MPRLKKATVLPLETELRAAAAVLAREIGEPGPELLAWAETSGLVNGKTDLVKVLAQQAALELLLLTVADQLPVEVFTSLPLKEVAAQLPYTLLLSNTKARSLLGRPEKILETLQHELPRDVLGALYEALTPQAERRTLGQYWTPEPIVEFMTAWTLGAGPRLLEPAIGSGRFLQEVERQLLAEPGEQHATVQGFEVSPLVLLVAIVNAALRYTNEVTFDLRLGSFLDDVAATPFDGVICNPPYTRHHHITPEQKAELSAQIEKTFGVKPSGFTSLFVYFLLHSLKQVRPGGRLAFITPAELYEASYAEQVKTILKKEAQPDAILVFDSSHQVFEGVDTAGCITLMRRGGNQQEQTLLIEVREWPGTATLLHVVDERRAGQYEWGTVTVLTAEELTVTAKWSNPKQMVASDHKSSLEHLPQLSEVASVVRGVATGANDYFCLTGDEVAATGISLDYFQPVITKTRKIRSLQLRAEDLEKMQDTGDKVWLFSCYEPRERMSPAVEKYVALGEELKLHERSLLKQKKAKWYMAEKRTPPPILFTYLSRGGTRFIYNAAGAQALNVFLLIYPKKTITNDVTTLKAFIAILNSRPIREGLHVVGRSYGGDTVKLEPRELDRLRVIDPTGLPAGTVSELAGMLNQLDVDQTGAVQEALDTLVEGLLQQDRTAPPAHTVERKPSVQPTLF